jgi:peptide/nickel transport system permease protein
MAIDRPDPASALTLHEPAAAVPPASPRAARLGRRERYAELARALLHSKTFVVGAFILLFWILDAMLWRVLTTHDPSAVDPTATLRGPSAEHFFGTDDLGRDVFSRVLAGAQSVLTVAPAATALGIFGGVAVGLVTGYYRGLVDDIVMRMIDAALAFPLIIIAVLVLAVLGRSTVNVVLVIGIVFTPLVSRTVRSAVLVEREREYVAAAKLRGESGFYIMAAEILPNITAPIAVEATIRLGYAIFTSATLSFLGLGLRPPSPDWGLAVASGRAFLQIAPWIVLFPALALATLVIAVNLVADGLKQVVEE